MAAAAFYTTKKEQGTILVETSKILDEDLLNSLASGAGELFLTGISSQCTPGRIMRVATYFGEVFILRFKIDSRGKCRGFAYLQYIDQANSALALKRLEHRFFKNGLIIKVKASKNIRELALHDIYPLRPMQVYRELQQLGEFEKLTIYGYHPDCFLYVIRYPSNAAVCLAHQTIQMNIGLFGNRAKVIWLDVNHPLRCMNINTHCCVKWHKQNIGDQVELLLLYPNQCQCFPLPCSKFD